MVASIFHIIFPLFLFADSSAISYPVVIRQFGTFENAVSIAASQRKSIFVADQNTALVHQFLLDGKKEKTIGGRGWGNYEFDSPADIVASFLHELFIVDRNNRRIQQYDRNLNFSQTLNSETIPLFNEQFFPRSAAVSRLGNLFILDSDQNRVIKLGARNQIEKIFGMYKDGSGKLINPKDILCSSSDEIVVLDGYRLVYYDVFGNFIKEILLEKKEQWLTVSSSENNVFAVSKNKIICISPNGVIQYEITINSLLSDVRPAEFRDCAAMGNQLYILTPNAILLCEIPSR